jgi:tripartite-type tricarboxylate transporter receptor subunit TctC
VKSVQELIALAKAKPGYLNYGTGGVGSNPHFAAALFNYMAGTQMTHVPYKGGALHTPGVVAGEVHLNMTGPLEVLSYIKAGRLRALGVTSTKRWASMPELPTISESGVPGYEFSAWYGVLAPAGLPKPLTSRLHSEIVKALRAPELRKTLEAQSMDIVSNSPEQFAQQIKTELAKWQAVAQQAGIKPE